MKKLFKKISSLKKSSGNEDAIQAGRHAAENTPLDDQVVILESDQDQGHKPQQTFSNSNNHNVLSGIYHTNSIDYDFRPSTTTIPSLGVGQNREVLHYENHFFSPIKKVTQGEIQQDHPMNNHNCSPIGHNTASPVTSSEFFPGANNFPVPRFIFQNENPDDVSDLENDSCFAQFEEEDKNYSNQEFQKLQSQNSQQQFQFNDQVGFQHSYYFQGNFQQYSNGTEPVGSYSSKDIEQCILNSQQFPHTQNYHQNGFTHLNEVNYPIDSEVNYISNYAISNNNINSYSYDYELAYKKKLNKSSDSSQKLTEIHSMNPSKSLDSNTNPHSASMFLRTLSMEGGIHKIEDNNNFFDDIEIVPESGNSVFGDDSVVFPKSTHEVSRKQDSNLEYDTQVAIEASLLEENIRIENLYNEEQIFEFVKIQSLHEHHLKQQQQQKVESEKFTWHYQQNINSHSNHNDDSDDCVNFVDEELNIDKLKIDDTKTNQDIDNVTPPKSSTPNNNPSYTSYNSSCTNSINNEDHVLKAIKSIDFKPDIKIVIPDQGTTKFTNLYPKLSPHSQIFYNFSSIPSQQHSSVSSKTESLIQDIIKTTSQSPHSITLTSNEPTHEYVPESIQSVPSTVRPSLPSDPSNAPSSAPNSISPSSSLSSAPSIAPTSAPTTELTSSQTVSSKTQTEPVTEKIYTYNIPPSSNSQSLFSPSHKYQQQFSRIHPNNAHSNNNTTSSNPPTQLPLNSIHLGLNPSHSPYTQPIALKQFSMKNNPDSPKTTKSLLPSYPYQTNVSIASSYNSTGSLIHYKDSNTSN